MAGKSMRGGLAAVFVAVVAGIMFAGYNYLLLRKRKREEEGADGIPADVKLLQEDSVIVVEGDTCQLEAELTGDPDPKAVWFRDGREIKESSIFKITREDNKSILCCQNMETGMAGKYTIKAANAFGVAKASTKVYVDKGGVPPAFETKPESVGVLEGEHCLLEVEVTGDPAPTIQWFKDNQEITECFEYKIITKGNKSMLVIDKADVSMGGAYVVKATNKAGSEECSSLLSVKKAGKPPVFESKLSFKPLKVKEGEKCSMEVVVSGYPAPTVTWFKDNQEIVESSLYKFVQEEDKAILVIERAEVDIGGAYVVKATNEHGEVECNTDLTIQKAAKIPSFTRELKPLTIKENESCRLEVEVEGEPMPKVTWFKDGDQILDTAAFMANGKKFALAIDSVSLNMGGVYKVRAENEAGSKECQAKLTVEKAAIAPSFSKELKPLTVKEKETCRLEVEVEGDPVPKVTWFKDGDQILDIVNYKFITDGKRFTLLIDSASPDMGGAYKAKAENEAGSVVSQAQLTVEKESQARKTAKGKESGEEEESVSDEQTGNSPHLTFSIEDVDHETEYQSRDYRRDIVVPAAGDIPIPSAPPPTRNTSENGLSEAFSSPSSTQDSFRNLVNNLSSIQDVAFVEEKLNSLNSADNESQGNTNSEPSSWVNVEENSSFQSASSLSPEKSEPSSWVKVEKDEQTGDPRDPFGSTPFEEALKAIGCSETAEVPPAGETDETKEVPQSAKSSRDSVSPSKVPEQVLERAPLLGFDDREDLPNQADIFATEREASVEPSSSASGEEAEAEPQEQDEGVSEEDATECLENVQRRPGELGPREAQVLVSLLSTRDYDLLEKVLKTIQNAAAFTSCQKTLSDAGCLKKLHHLLRAHSMAIRMGQSVSYPAVVSGVATTINNLAMNTANQKELKDCIPTLIDFAVSEKSPEPVQLSALQALTNLSVMSEYHGPYTQLVQTLYEYLDTRHSEVQLQALKVLVNLSTNADMVPHLLAARAPSCVLELLVPDTSTDLLLRWLTLLGNIMHTAKEQGITYASLPTDYKAPSPETMYSALYGMKESMHVRSKVFVLSKHENEDIRYHAARVYSSL